MTDRANAQPSGGDGAMTDERRAQVEETSRRLHGLSTGNSAIADVIDELLEHCNNLQARLDAAERVVAVVRSEYPDSAWEVWKKNFAEQPDEVTERTHVRRVIKAVLEYDAATHPDDGGDDA